MKAILVFKVTTRTVRSTKKKTTMNKISKVTAKEVVIGQGLVPKSYNLSKGRWVCDFDVRVM